MRRKLFKVSFCKNFALRKTREKCTHTLSIKCTTEFARSVQLSCTVRCRGNVQGGREHCIVNYTSTQSSLIR